MLRIARLSDRHGTDRAAFLVGKRFVGQGSRAAFGEVGKRAGTAPSDRLAFIDAPIEGLEAATLGELLEQPHRLMELEPVRLVREALD